jgi:hypothetical protein
MTWSGSTSVPGVMSERIPPTEATETTASAPASLSAQMFAR